MTRSDKKAPSRQKSAAESTKKEPKLVDSTYQILSNGKRKQVSMLRQQGLFSRPKMVAFIVREKKGKAWEHYKLPEKGSPDYNLKMSFVDKAAQARKRDGGSLEFSAKKKNIERDASPAQQKKKKKKTQLQRRSGSPRTKE